MMNTGSGENATCEEVATLISTLETSKLLIISNISALDKITTYLSTETLSVSGGTSINSMAKSKSKSNILVASSGGGNDSDPLTIPPSNPSSRAADNEVEAVDTASLKIKKNAMHKLKALTEMRIMLAGNSDYLRILSHYSDICSFVSSFLMTQRRPLLPTANKNDRSSISSTATTPADKLNDTIQKKLVDILPELQIGDNLLKFHSLLLKLEKIKNLVLNYCASSLAKKGSVSINEFQVVKDFYTLRDPELLDIYNTLSIEYEFESHLSLQSHLSLSAKRNKVMSLDKVSFDILSETIAYNIFQFVNIYIPLFNNEPQEDGQINNNNTNQINMKFMSSLRILNRDNKISVSIELPLATSGILGARIEGSISENEHHQLALKSLLISKKVILKHIHVKLLAFKLSPVESVSIEFMDKTFKQFEEELETLNNLFKWFASWIDGIDRMNNKLLTMFKIICSQSTMNIAGDINGLNPSESAKYFYKYVLQQIVLESFITLGYKETISIVVKKLMGGLEVYSQASKRGSLLKYGMLVYKRIMEHASLLSRLFSKGDDFNFIIETPIQWLISANDLKSLISILIIKQHSKKIAYVAKHLAESAIKQECFANVYTWPDSANVHNTSSSAKNDGNSATYNTTPELTYYQDLKLINLNDKVNGNSVKIEYNPMLDFSVMLEANSNFFSQALSPVPAINKSLSTISSSSSQNDVYIVGKELLSIQNVKKNNYSNAATMKGQYYYAFFRNTYYKAVIELTESITSDLKKSMSINKKFEKAPSITIDRLLTVDDIILTTFRSFSQSFFPVYRALYAEAIVEYKRWMLLALYGKPKHVFGYEQSLKAKNIIGELDNKANSMHTDYSLTYDKSLVPDNAFEKIDRFKNREHLAAANILPFLTAQIISLNECMAYSTELIKKTQPRPSIARNVTNSANSVSSELQFELDKLTKLFSGWDISSNQLISTPSKQSGIVNSVIEVALMILGLNCYIDNPRYNNNTAISTLGMASSSMKGARLDNAKELNKKENGSSGSFSKAAQAIKATLSNSNKNYIDFGDEYFEHLEQISESFFDNWSHLVETVFKHIPLAIADYMIKCIYLEVMTGFLEFTNYYATHYHNYNSKSIASLFALDGLSSRFSGYSKSASNKQNHPNDQPRSKFLNVFYYIFGKDNMYFTYTNEFFARFHEEILDFYGLNTETMSTVGPLVTVPTIPSKHSDQEMGDKTGGASTCLARDAKTRFVYTQLEAANVGMQAKQVNTAYECYLMAYQAPDRWEITELVESGMKLIDLISPLLSMPPSQISSSSLVLTVSEIQSQDPSFTASHAINLLNCLAATFKYTDSSSSNIDPASGSSLTGFSLFNDEDNDDNQSINSSNEPKSSTSLTKNAITQASIEITEAINIIKNDAILDTPTPSHTLKKTNFKFYSLS